MRVYCLSPNFFKSTLLLLFAWFVSFPLQGQTIRGNLDLSDTTQVHKIITREGDQFVGRITAIENTKVTFLFNDKIELHFELAQLELILVTNAEDASKVYLDEKSRKVIQEKPREMHGHESLIPYLAPTGFNLKKKETEIRNYSLFLFSVDHGLNDHLSIGADIVPLPFIVIANTRIKASYSLGESVHGSLSANLGGFLSFGDIEGLAYTSGALTFGNPDLFLNFTASFGQPLDNTSTPFVLYTAGGSIRAGKDLKFTSTFLFGEVDDGFFGLNGTLGWFNHNHRVDVGLAILVVPFETIPIPSASYAYRFGNGRKL